MARIIRLPSAHHVLAAVAALACALAVSACGGDDKAKPILPGTSNADPASPEFGDNVVRIPGVSTTDVAAAGLLTAYPPDDDEEEEPSGWVMFTKGDWTAAANAAQFAAAPVNAGLLPIERDFLPPAAVDLLDRINPAGFPNGRGLKVLVLGRVGEEVAAAIEEAKLDLARILQPTAAEVALELAPFRGGWAEAYSDSIVVVSSDKAARDYAFPAMAWSAYSGDTIAFVEGGSVPSATKRIVGEREKLRLQPPTIYLVGPESVIPESVADELSGFGEVKRIAGETAVETAIAVARYQDKETAFGWGAKKGPANILLANRQEPGDAIGALSLAAAGPQAPLLLNDGAKKLSPAVAEYLKELRNRDGNQGYLFGDQESLSSPLLADVDRLLAPGSPEKGGGAAGGD